MTTHGFDNMERDDPKGDLIKFCEERIEVLEHEQPYKLATCTQETKHVLTYSKNSKTTDQRRSLLRSAGKFPTQKLPIRSL
jgi:hypothetical protein